MDSKLLVHKHLIIRAEAIRPPMDEELLTNWLRDFIDSINKTKTLRNSMLGM